MLMCCISDVPEPNITVYRQMEDRDHVIVLCKFAEVFTTRRESFELSVESELNYNIEPLQFPFFPSEMHVYMVTVIPPAFFTCVHEIGFDPDVRNLRSQTYNYSGSGKQIHLCKNIYMLLPCLDHTVLLNACIFLF